MRVITWNCHGARPTSAAWDYFSELCPDIALLQEVCGIPAEVAQRWRRVGLLAITKHGSAQRFQTVVLTRGDITDVFPLTSPDAWVQSELIRFSGNLVACIVSLDDEVINLVSVYSPAWPVDRSRLAGIDTAGVRLVQNADVWVTDLLLASLRQMQSSADDLWMIGGDFNLSETFDSWRGGPRGNREYLDRMSAFGLTECLRHSKGKLTPTFRNASNAQVLHQMDHLFATRPLADRLVRCDVGDSERVFGGLSDHLPIIAEFQPNRLDRSTAADARSAKPPFPAPVPHV